MIQIHTDPKSGCYVLTKTQEVEGMRLHSQLTITRSELIQLRRLSGCRYADIRATGHVSNMITDNKAKTL